MHLTWGRRVCSLWRIRWRSRYKNLHSRCRKNFPLKWSYRYEFQEETRICCELYVEEQLGESRVVAITFYEWEDGEEGTCQNNVTFTPAVQQAVRDMSGFRTQYTRLNSNSDDPEEDLPPQYIAARGFEEVEKGTCKLKYRQYLHFFCTCLPFVSFVTVVFRREGQHDILDVRNKSAYEAVSRKI